MSEVKVNKISPRSGTDVQLGDSGDTITVPTGATFDASNATTTLPATVVTTTGTQTLTNKTIDASQLSGTITPSDNTVTLAKLTATGTKDATTFLRGDNTFAEAGGGKILQVVNATDTTQRTTTSSSFVTASNTLSVDITPSATSSKILILVSTSVYMVSVDLYTTIFRDSTNLGNATTGMCKDRAENGIAIHYLDSPSTTSQVTYQVYIKSNGLDTVYLNTASFGSITAFEIGA